MGSGVPWAVTITNDYTVKVFNQMILADTRSRSITISLPPIIELAPITLTPPGNSYRIISFKKVSASNTLTITPLNGATIDGGGSIVITALNDSVTLRFDGTNFYILGNTSSSSGGTVTSVGATGGTGISVAGSPITTSGTFIITNTLPDQTVVLTPGSGISISGTYPNFTINNTSPSSGGTITSIATTAPILGGTITTSGTISLQPSGVTNSYLATPYITINALGGLGGGGTVNLGGTISISASGLPSGTVTSFSSGNLSPLFTTSVTTSTSTPVLSFTAISEPSGLVYASPSGTSGIPSFRQLVTSDLPSGLSPLTTKGDLFTFSNVNARLPVGIDGTILTADSTTTTGNKWGFPNGTWCSTAGGTANALTLTPVPAIVSYASAVGQRYYFMASANTSSTSPTMAISGLSAIIMSMGNTTIPIGGLIAGNVYVVVVQSATVLRVAPYDCVSVNGDTMNGKLYIYPTDSLEVGQSSTADGQITFRNATSNSYVRIQTGGTGSNWSLSLPTSAGGANTFLHNGGSGVTAWSAVNIATADITGTLPVANGGTGVTSFTAYNILAAGTTTTGALQNIGVGTSGQVLTSNGAGALPTMQSFTSAETNSTPVADNNQTAGFGSATQFYYFITLPTTYAWYHITGIEWKNGTSVSGTVYSGVEMVDANPPVSQFSMYVALGQNVTQSGVSAVQRTSVVTSQEIPGGSVLGIWFFNSNGTGNFRYLSAQPSINMTKAATASPQLNNTSAWSTNTIYPYLKLYYKGHN